MIYTPGKFNETFDVCACMILLVLIVSRLARGFNRTLERKSSIALLLLDVNVFLSALLEFGWCYMVNHPAGYQPWLLAACGMLQKVIFSSITFIFFLFALFLVVGEQPLEKEQWLFYCLPYVAVLLLLAFPGTRQKIYLTALPARVQWGPWHWVLNFVAILYLLGALKSVWPKWRELGERFWWIVSFEVVYVLITVLRYRFVYLRVTHFLLAISLLILTLFIGDFDIRSWHEQSVIDELAEVKNRYGFRHDFRFFVDKDICVAMLDIDYFKDFNDMAGHGCGDEVIQVVGQTGRLFFGNDIYRYGGDEFLIVTSRMMPQKFIKELHRMADSVESAYIEGAPRRVTLTMGYCFGHPNNNQELRDLLTKADRNLYVGKEAGRGKIVGDKLTS
ncbi:GGDEF domain-containing protein [Lactobacillus porci]|uniref:GGDEF domain-containing protein n=1 Tax=Lactobacillus porci TaxID=2012477 RepID=UPI003995459B